MITMMSLFYDRKRLKIKMKRTKLKKILNNDDILHRIKRRTLT